MRLPRFTLAGKLFSTSALIILIAVGTVGYIGYWQSRRTIMEEAQKHVMSVLFERKARISAWMSEHTRIAEYIARSPEVSSLINVVYGGKQKDRQAAIQRLTELLNVHHSMHQTFLSCGTYDTLGNTIAISGEYTDLVQPSELNGFNDALKNNTSIGTIHLSRNDTPLINIAAPIPSDQIRPLGVYICQISTTNSLESILIDTTGLGLSGECYLVGRDTVMLTPSRFMQHPPALKHKMPIPTVLEALSGKSGVMVYDGFLGEKVVGAYAYVSGLECALIVEMHLDEALLPAHTIARSTVIAALSSLVLMLIVSLILAQTWVSPIKQLADASDEVAGGNLAVRVPEEFRSDEIGTLNHQFNRMVSSLQSSRADLERTHSELLQAEKMAAIGQLATGIVHEMRNPLSTIKMTVQILRRKLESDDRRLQHLDLASVESERLEKMLDELLDFSKPVDIKRELIDAREIAQKTVESFQYPGQKHGVNLSLTCDDEHSDFRVMADEDILTRLLTNLISNALHACEKDGVVTLNLRDDGENLIFEVCDNGHGMTGQTISRIFDPFYTTRENGIGLGMSNVKKFVDLHNGSIVIESTEGKGATVTVKIPKGDIGG